MTSRVSLDSICTCKVCGHDMARDCINTACSCCSGRDHSMIMDGMEGFPAERKGKLVKLQNVTGQ